MLLKPAKTFIKATNDKNGSDNTLSTITKDKYIDLILIGTKSASEIT